MATETLKTPSVCVASYAWNTSAWCSTAMARACPCSTISISMSPTENSSVWSDLRDAASRRCSMCHGRLPFSDQWIGHHRRRSRPRARSSPHPCLPGTRRLSLAYGRGKYRIRAIQAVARGTRATHRPLCSNGCACRASNTAYPSDLSGGMKQRLAGGPRVGGQSRHPLSR